MGSGRDFDRSERTRWTRGMEISRRHMQDRSQLKISWRSTQGILRRFGGLQSGVTNVTSRQMHRESDRKSKEARLPKYNGVRLMLWLRLLRWLKCSMTATYVWQAEDWNSMSTLFSLIAHGLPKFDLF